MIKRIIRFIFGILSMVFLLPVIFIFAFVEWTITDNMSVKEAWKESWNNIYD